MIELDKETHTYRVDGVIKPSVSDILAAVSAYDNIPNHILQSAAHFGSAVHKACELDDLGELDESTLDPMIEPYLIGWRGFVDKHVVSFSSIETSLYSETFGYCGTPDRIGVIQYQGKLSDCLIDIKTTSKHMPSTALQTAAYCMAYGKRLVRLAVRLKPGGFDLNFYDDDHDFAVFTSLVVARNWCQRTKSTLNLEKYGVNDGN